MKVGLIWISQHGRRARGHTWRGSAAECIFSEEITFRKTSGIDRSMKLAVARVHRNMGHLFQLQR